MFSFALEIVPGVSIIVSLTSISVSSKSLVEIVINPDFSPDGIIIESLLTVYSSFISAVPEKVRGIDTSSPETLSSSAVKIISVSEFSIISYDDDEKLTFGASSLSIMVRVNSSDDVAFKFMNLFGLIIKLSEDSFDESSRVLIVTDPVVSPAFISISTFTILEIILWFFSSDTKILSSSST